MQTLEKVKVYACFIWLLFLIKHHKDTSLNEIVPHFQSCMKYSTLNSEHVWKDEVFNERVDKCALPITITTLGEVRFSI